MALGEFLYYLQTDPAATLMMVALATLLVSLILLVCKSLLEIVTWERGMVEYRRRVERERFLATLRREETWR